MKTPSDLKVVSASASLAVQLGVVSAPEGRQGGGGQAGVLGVLGVSSLVSLPH